MNVWLTVTEIMITTFDGGWWPILQVLSPARQPSA
jgi:hypothetical protein